jgi:hypothetical protein
MRYGILVFVSICFELRLEGERNYGSLREFVEGYCKRFGVETTREVGGKKRKLNIMRMITGVVEKMRKAGLMMEDEIEMEKEGEGVRESESIKSNTKPLSENKLDSNSNLKRVEQLEVLQAINHFIDEKGIRSEAFREVSELMNKKDDSKLKKMRRGLEKLLEEINEIQPYPSSPSSNHPESQRRQ